MPAPYSVAVGPWIDEGVRKFVGPDIDKFQYDKKKGLTNEIRSLILVIVTLIATVAFQAGINPPGGLWQDNQNGVNGHVAGSAIFAYRKQTAYYVFMFFNTLAFTTSTFIIFVSIQGFPFRTEIRLAIVSIVVPYFCAVFAVSPPELANLAYVLLLAFLPIVAYLTRMCFRQRERAPENDSGSVTTGDEEGSNLDSNCAYHQGCPHFASQ